MLDIKWIREHQEQVQLIAEHKGIDLAIPELLRRDDQRRALLLEVERLRQERNRLTQRIQGFIRERAVEEAESCKGEVKTLNRRLTGLEHELQEAEREYRDLMLLVPNPISPDTPIGRSDRDNVEVRRAGEPPAFGFEPRDHVALGELHRLIDIPRGVKTAGSRNYYLTGIGVLLHRAVQQLAVDLLVAKGFALFEVPLMVRPAAMLNTGFFPLGQDQTYRIAEEDRCLVGTSEVPLVSYFEDEIVDVARPLKLAAASLCFRNEVGSAGKDVHGLYRVRQFAKVEQVILCQNDPEVSEQLFQEITENAEELLRLLELPYRVMAVCSGDMSQKNVQTIRYRNVDAEPGGVRGNPFVVAAARFSGPPVEHPVQGSQRQTAVLLHIEQHGGGLAPHSDPAAGKPPGRRRKHPDSAGAAQVHERIGKDRTTI